MDGQLLTFLTGAGTALAPVLLWELGIKPWRDRRALAEVLRSEIEFSTQVLADAEAIRRDDPRYVIADFRPTTAAYAALLGRLGELPTEALRDLLMFYRGVAYLLAEQSVLQTEETRKRERTGQINLPPIAFQSFDTALSNTIGYGVRALAHLDEIADPGLERERRSWASIEQLRRLAQQRLARRTEADL
jgi:hypothetical protein